MPDQVLFSAPYGSLLLDEQVPCLISQWHGFANRTDFKTLLTFGLTYYQAHSTPAHPWGWVADTRHMSAIPQEVQQWLTQQWNADLFAAGLREMSVVTSDNIFGRLAVTQYAQDTQAQQPQYELATAYYPTLEAAKQGARAALAPRR